MTATEIMIRDGYMVVLSRNERPIGNIFVVDAGKMAGASVRVVGITIHEDWVRQANDCGCEKIPIKVYKDYYPYAYKVIAE